MSFDYSSSAATALKLLTRFGGDIKLVRKTGDSVNPVTGVIAAGTDASVTTTGLIKPYNDKMIDGSRVLMGDKELVLSNEHEPLLTDKPVIDGEEWSIVKINVVKPFNTAIRYLCQVRK